MNRIIILLCVLLSTQALLARTEREDGDTIVIEDKGICWKYIQANADPSGLFIKKIILGAEFDSDTLFIDRDISFKGVEYYLHSVSCEIKWSSEKERSLHVEITGPTRFSSIIGNVTSIRLPDNSTLWTYPEFPQSLKHIDWPQDIKDIPRDCFKNTLLEDFDFSMIDSIGNSAFENTPLTSVDLTNVKKIGDYAFRGSMLENVVLPDSLLRLGAEAFRGCRLTSLDVHRTVIDHTNSDIICDNPDFRKLTAPNLRYIEKGAFSGTSIDRLEGFPNVEIVIDPIPYGRYKRIDLPSARHLELRYALVDTLILGKNAVDKESIVKIWDIFDSYSYYRDIEFAGIQPGTSWFGHIEVDPENPDFAVDNDNALYRKNWESSWAMFIPLRYYKDEPNVVINIDETIDDRACVIARGMPATSEAVFKSSEHQPGGAVLCDAIDTVFIDSRMTYLREYSYRGNMNIDNDDRYYYRRLSLRLSKPREDNPVRVYIHPDIEKNVTEVNSPDWLHWHQWNQTTAEMMVCWAEGDPHEVSTRYGFIPVYGYDREDPALRSFVFITQKDDPDGVIDRWLEEEKSGLTDLINDPGRKDVYTLQGTLVRRNASEAEINALTPGLYIIGGKKVMKR